MAEGKSRLLWDQTSHVLAMLYNANRAKDADAASFRDFHPYYFRESQEVAYTTSDLSFMKPMCRE